MSFHTARLCLLASDRLTYIYIQVQHVRSEIAALFKNKFEILHDVTNKTHTEINHTTKDPEHTAQDRANQPHKNIMEPAYRISQCFAQYYECTMKSL